MKSKLKIEGSTCPGGDAKPKDHRNGDHPVHPMLIPFPVAFLVATRVCDLIFWRTGNAG